MAWLLVRWLLLRWLLLRWPFKWLFLFQMAASSMAASNFQSLQNSLWRNWMLRQPLLFDWLPKHPVFWFTHNTVSQVAYGYLSSLCSTCVTYGKSCRAIGHQVLPTQPLPREAEDFPRGERHFKHVPPLLTYLIYLSLKEFY